MATVDQTLTWVAPQVEHLLALDGGAGQGGTAECGRPRRARQQEVPPSAGATALAPRDDHRRSVRRPSRGCIGRVATGPVTEHRLGSGTLLRPGGFA